MRIDNGIHTLTPGNANPGGMIPTTVRLTPSSRIAFPRIAESEPNRSFQSWLASMATLAFPGSPSPARKPRPISGFVRRVEKKSVVTYATGIWAESPAPVKLAVFPLPKEAICSKARSWPRNAR